MNSKKTTLMRHIKLIVAIKVLFFISVKISFAQEQTSNWMLSGETRYFGSNTLKHGINATVYLKPFKYTSGPNAERDFLNPTDSLQLSGYTEKVNNALLGYESSGAETSVSYSRVMGKHVLSPRLFGSNYEGRTTFGAGIDYRYLINHSTQAFVGIGVAKEELAKGSTTANTFDTGYRKLWQFKNGKSLAANVQLGYTRSENESRDYSILDISTGLDYYFSNRWGAGIDLKLSSSDVPIHQSYGLGLSTEYFFTDKFSANLNVQLVDYLQDSSVGLGIKKYF